MFFAGYLVCGYAFKKMARHLAATHLVRVPSLSSLGVLLPTSLLRARIERNRWWRRCYPLCSSTVALALAIKKKGNQQSNNTIDRQDFYALQSFLFLSFYEISFYHDQDSGYDLNASM